MKAVEIANMKANPGLYLVRVAHPLFGEREGLLVASIGGKLYGMVADNQLADEGWHPATKLERCLYEGGLSRIEA